MLQIKIKRTFGFLQSTNETQRVEAEGWHCKVDGLRGAIARILWLYYILSGLRESKRWKSWIKILTWKDAQRDANKRPSETRNRRKPKKKIPWEVPVKLKDSSSTIQNRCHVIDRPSTARHKMLFEERLGGEERRLMHLVPALTSAICRPAPAGISWG
jgi:hypothetical protein